MSFLEIVVTAALVLVLGSMIAVVLPPLVDTTRRSTVRSGLQQEAMVALNKIEGDLMNSSSAGITLLSPDPVVLCIDRLESGPFQGQPRWETEYTIYAWTPADKTLVRKRWPPHPPDNTPTLTGSAPAACDLDLLGTIVRQRNTTETYLSRHASAFAVDSEGAGAFTVRIDVEEALDDRRTEKFSGSRRVQVRNTP